MKIYKKCEICGKEYATGNGKAKYCSDECRKVAYQNRQKKFKENHPDYRKQYRLEKGK